MSAMLARRARLLHRFAAVLTAVALSACGGQSSPPEPPPPPPPEPDEPLIDTRGPGEFKKATLLASFSQTQIAAAITAGSTATPPKTPALSARWGVRLYRLEYLTVDGKGHEVLASALAAIPDKAPAARSPVMSLQHGTIQQDAEAPSNIVEAANPGAIMASLGYIVLAPDYVGYGSSKGVPHPYLQADASASVVTDLLTAAKYWRLTQRIRDNRQLFLTGYSEGGYTTLAALRNMQSSKHRQLQELVAAVPAAGPYNLVVTLGVQLQRLQVENPLLATVLSPGTLSKLPLAVRNELRKLLIKKALGDDADTSLQADFLDLYMADDLEGLARFSHVHDFKPEVPTWFYHGREDRTVPYEAAQVTLTAMQARGAGALVSLTDCSNVTPTGHLECVQPYWRFVLDKFGPLARDL